MNARRSLCLLLALALAGCASAAGPAAQTPPARTPPEASAPAQRTPVAGAPLTLAPERPQADRPVTVTYDPRATDARLRAPDSLELVYRTQDPDYRILPMQKDGPRWTARFTPKPGAAFLRLYVQADSTKDQQGGSVGWGRMIYGADGRPVRGAHTARADYLRQQRPGAPGRIEPMMAAYGQELARFPDHLVAQAHLRAFEAQRAGGPRADSLRRAVRSEIESARRRYAADPERLREVQRALYALGRRGEAQAVGATLMELDEDGPEAVVGAFRRATAEGQSTDRLRNRADDFLARYPNSFFVSGVHEALFRTYRDDARPDSMIQAARRWIRTEPVNKSRAHGQLAGALSSLGRYDAALREARRAIELADEVPAGYTLYQTGDGWDWAATPLTPAERRAQGRRQRGAQRALLGRIHYRRGDYARAAEVLAQALRENPDDATSWTRLANAYQRTGRPTRAFGAAENALRRDPTYGPARSLFRRLYTRRNGAEEGLRAAVVDLARGKLQREALDASAPPLRLVPLDETDAQAPSPVDSLRAEALEGKVLVLDFWASWCGPCHQAFPHLQTVYETYRDAPDVEFLVINTSWNESRERARQVLEEAGYTFPAYWDTGGEVSEAFEVGSIPTTVLVGKDGRVQYRESGFGGPAHYVDNLSLRIDVLRDS